MMFFDDPDHLRLIEPLYAEPACIARPEEWELRLAEPRPSVVLSGLALLGKLAWCALDRIGGSL